jgi:hypothetical protein
MLKVCALAPEDHGSKVLTPRSRGNLHSPSNSAAFLALSDIDMLEILIVTVEMQVTYLFNF